MKFNKTELKLLAMIEFYKSIGFCGLDKSNGVRLKQAARTLSKKGIVTIKLHKHDDCLWFVSLAG